MSQNIRQSNLFAAEDFTKIYQSFKDVDFKAYDFDTIQQAMINNLRLHYPESFNDYIESSEYIATIQLLAYIASSLAFRVDLNSRENFLDTAERRESIIRLARMINYQPKRNLAASGLFKIVGIQTSEAVLDSLGRSLQDTTIFWNDPNNPDSYSQFISVMNATLSSTNPFGKPFKQKTVGGIPSSIYQINNIKGIEVAYSVPISANGEQLPFDIVNVDFNDAGVFEETHPDPDNAFQLLYRNDSQGLSSNNTGFFFFFKQGTLQSFDNRFDFPIQNRVVSIDKTNINETDVYVQEINQLGQVQQKWTKVPNVNGGSNVIYNSLNLNERNIYAVISGLNDTISINYPDGNFGNVPTGIFRTWYRTSANKNFTLRPAEAQSLEIPINYIGKDGNEYVVRFIFSLMESVSNSSPSETNNQVKIRAPQVYYTQDRMVNNEDYNVYPLTRGNQIAKVRTINRTHAGHSRYIDINDPTGFHQNLIVNGDDGAIYRDYKTPYVTVQLENEINEEKVIAGVSLKNFLSNDALVTFFYDEYLNEYKKYKEDNFSTSNIYDTYNKFNVFEFTNTSTNLPTTFNGVYEFLPVPLSDLNNQGVFSNTSTSIIDRTEAVYDHLNPKRKVNVTDENLGENEFGKFKFIALGCKVIFRDPTDETKEKSATVTSITSLDVGSLFTLDIPVPRGWIIRFIYPRFKSSFDQDEISNIVVQLKNRNNFSLSYDVEVLTNPWRVTSNTTATGFFSFSQDSLSWLIVGQYDVASTTYEFKSRGLVYIFESYRDVRFFFDADQNNYDIETEKAYRDIIEITPQNYEPEIREIWEFKNLRWTNVFDETVSYPFTTISFIPLRSRSVGDTDVVVEELTGSKFTFSIESGVLYIRGSAPSTGDQISIRYISPVTTLSKPVSWNINSLVLQEDGYIDNSKVEVISADTDADGIPDSFFSFYNLVSSDDIVFLENYQNLDGYISKRLWSSKWLDIRKEDLASFEFTYQDIVDKELFLCISTQLTELKERISNIVIDQIINGHQTIESLSSLNNVNSTVLFTERKEPNNLQIILDNTPSLLILEKILINTETVINILEEIQLDPSLTVDDIIDMGLDPTYYEEDTDHFVKNGRTFTQDEDAVSRNNFYFKWDHYAPSENRIDPSISNIMDMILLTNDYYTDVIKWKTKKLTLAEYPEPPSTESLRIQFNALDNVKMMSDQIIYQSAKFKLLFGPQAHVELRAKFKVVKIPSTLVTDNEVKSKVIQAIDDYFNIQNWDFGESFFFTELASYIHQKLANIIGTIVIVPSNRDGQFGNLFQIKSEANELFLSTATVADVEIITNLTESNMRL